MNTKQLKPEAHWGRMFLYGLAARNPDLERYEHSLKWLQLIKVNQ